MADKKDQLVKNAADPEQIKEATKSGKKKRARELNDIYNMLLTVYGRRLLYRLVNEICHYDADDAAPSGSWTYYNLGERNVGRQLKSDCIEASLELWQKAEQENWEFLKKE